MRAGFEELVSSGESCRWDMALPLYQCILLIQKDIELCCVRHDGYWWVSSIILLSTEQVSWRNRTQNCTTALLLKQASYVLSKGMTGLWVSLTSSSLCPLCLHSWEKINHVLTTGINSYSKVTCLVFLSESIGPITLYLGSPSGVCGM